MGALLPGFRRTNCGLLFFFAESLDGCGRLRVFDRVEAGGKLKMKGFSAFCALFLGGFWIG
jgi:hypothetical protein